MFIDVCYLKEHITYHLTKILNTMDEGIITGIATVVVLIIIFFWAYSVGKDYKSKKKVK